MATWVPINGLAVQLAKNAGGAAAADYYLKFYDEGTTTPASMATDSTGGTTLAKCKLDSNGLAVNGSDDPFIPHIDRNYKLACYTNAADADNDATGSAFFVIDSIKLGSADGVLYTPEGTNPTTVSIATYLDKRVLDDVTALRAYEPVVDEEQVFILGHTAKGKGGGELYYDETDTTTADNGVTVFVTSGGARWKRPQDDVIDVMQGGAVGDGVTDDTAAIQAAFDVFKDVFFPKGTYLISDTIEVGTLTKARNQSRFYGVAQGTKIQGSASMTGKAMFEIEGSQSFQQYGNTFEGLRLVLGGAAIGIDFNKGCYTSSVKDVRIEDDTSTSGVIGVRVFNSFNITMDNLQTVGLNGNAVLFKADTAQPGFANLTNCKITNSILQNQGASEVVNLVEFELNNAADTITIENTALKADATGSRCIWIDGFINQLSIKTCHFESSYSALCSEYNNTVYASVEDCIFTDVERGFDWEASGQIVLQNSRFVNGTGNYVFWAMYSDVEIVGQHLVASASYTPTVQNGKGRIRRSRNSIVTASGTRTVGQHEDNFTFYNSGGTLQIDLPETADVGEGFKVSTIRRGGNVTLQPTASDRILGVSGTSAGSSIELSGTGSYIELTSQNSVNGSQTYWIVTSLNGTAT